MAVSVLLVLVLTFAVAMVWVTDYWVMLAASAALFGIAALVACAWLIRGRWPVWAWLLLPVAAAPLWGLFQILSGVSADRFVTTVSVLKYGGVACAFLLATSAFLNPRANQTFRLLLVVLSTILAIIAILQLSTADGKIYWFIDAPPNATPMGPFVNRDNYSGFIALVLPLALWEAVRSTRAAWLNGIAAAIMYASVIAGLSRAGSILVTLEVVAVVVPALLARRNMKGAVIARTFAAVALIVLFSSAVGWSDLFARFDDQDPYGTDRRDFVQSSLLMLRDRPVLGFGLGTWSIIYPRYVVKDHGMGSGAAHNDWLQWACDGGLPFLAFMLIPAVWGSWQSLRFPWGLGVIAVSLQATVDFPFQRYPTLLCFFLMIAAMLASDRSWDSSGEGSDFQSCNREVQIPRELGEPRKSLV